MKLVLQITAGIVLAAFIIGGLWAGVSIGLPAYANSKVDKIAAEYIGDMEIDCSKKYTVKMVEAERLRRCK